MGCLKIKSFYDKVHVLFLFPQKSKARRRIFLRNSLEFEIFKTRSKILAFSHTKHLESS